MTKDARSDLCNIGGVGFWKQETYTHDELKKRMVRAYENGEKFGRQQGMWEALEMMKKKTTEWISRGNR